jgi:tRNA-dihydrouridine synthase B
MRIGNLHLSKPLFLAPMAGITDYPFRKVMRQFGCGLAFSEMVSAEGLLRKGKSFIRIVEDEHPVSVQLFGARSESLSEAARVVEAMGADIVDLNMGCPAKQVVKAGAGASLMRFPEKVKEILTTVRKSVKIPLTIKIRSGWDERHINAVEISRIAEDCGVNAISVHPRTREQGFHGLSDWGLIREVKRAVRIPVIGNGDVTAPSLIKKMVDETGCDGVMIGRGALGNPWIFRSEDSTHSEEGRAASLKERRHMIDDHLRLIRDYYGEKTAAKEVRKHLYWYTKGLPYCAAFHAKFTCLKEEAILFEALDSYFQLIEGRSRSLCRSFSPVVKGSITG